MGAAGRDLITIRDLRVRCVVGVYPQERDAPQPVGVDLDLYVDTERAARSERLSHTVDYDFLAAQMSFLLRNGHFRLLETAAHVLATYVLLPPVSPGSGPVVDRARVRLTKPGALAGAAIPSVEIEREGDWARRAVEEKAFGTVDVVHETRDAGVYRLNVAPGRGIPLHVHRTMREAEMVLGDGLWCQGKPARQGTVHRWPLDAPHGYQNPTEHWQSILCIDSPPFDEKDEVPVEGDYAIVTPEPHWWTSRPAPRPA